MSSAPVFFSWTIFTVGVGIILMTTESTRGKDISVLDALDSSLLTSSSACDCIAKSSDKLLKSTCANQWTNGTSPPCEEKSCTVFDSKSKRKFQSGVVCRKKVCEKLAPKNQNQTSLQEKTTCYLEMYSLNGSGEARLIFGECGYSHGICGCILDKQDLWTDVKNPPDFITTCSTT